MKLSKCLVGISSIAVALTLSACGGAAEGTASSEEAAASASATSASASAAPASASPAAESPSAEPAAPTEPDYAGFVQSIRTSVPQLSEPDDRLIEFGEQLCENTDPQELRNEIVILATIGGLGDAVASTFAGASFQYLCPDNKATYNDSLTLSAG